MEPSAVRLDDGRTLGWYEFGDRDGAPCLYLPGTPSSGRAGRAYDGPARAAGVRLISLDRPGYGRSDFVRRRSLAGLGADVVQLLRYLGVSRCALFGESGGAAFALALAHELPAAITIVALVAGVGPMGDSEALRDMKRGNRVLVKIARRTPWLLRPVFARQRSTFADPRRARAAVQRLVAAAPAADQQVYRDNPEPLAVAVDATVDALRSGSRGVAAELSLLARPWNFPLQQVRTPVVMWHGTDDANVPLAIAEHVAACLPDARLRVVDGGHIIGIELAAEVMLSISGAYESQGT